jgi:hypothetical protein
MRKSLSLATLGVAFLLSGCAVLPPVLQAGVAVAGAARAAYCLGISEDGKQGVRDVLTAGSQVITCEAPE